MNKELEVKKILVGLAAGTATRFRKLPESRIDDLSTSLCELTYASRDLIKEKIKFADPILKETIDFTDTDYWIDRIVDIINKR